MNGKIKVFAELLEKESKEDLQKRGLGCDANIENCKVKIVEGKKYTKIDVGSSGRYMVDGVGNIYGIKAYGVIHKGHTYGTLDTMGEYNWGGYSAYKK